MRLEAHLRAGRSSGRKLLVPYITGGLGSQWLDVLRAVIDGGADAVEIGIPFSDPIMDGRTIQEASQRALDLGATPTTVVEQLTGLDAPVPLVVMTYYNLVARNGHERFACNLRAAGVDAAIIPDLPLDELDGWADAGAHRTDRNRAPRRAHDHRHAPRADLPMFAGVRVRRVAPRGHR